MSIEEELPRLLDELADDHVVGPPPGLERHVVHETPGNRARPAFLTAAAVAASSVVLIGGLVAIGNRTNDPAPANPRSTAPPATDDSPSDPTVTSTPTSDPTGTDATTDATTEPAGPALDLIRIDARASAEGTTGVVLVFDGEVPSGTPELLSDPTARVSDRIGYITQTSGDSASGISVCGDSHWFPAPGNETVDIFVPSEWFGTKSLIDPPVEREPGSAALPKIVVCEPLNGAVQISVWGAASGRVEDVNVSVDASTIVVDIAPDDRVVDPASGVDGPVMRYLDRSETAEGLAAEVRGTLELEQDCLYVALDEVGERYPILWPASTTWNPDANTVVLPMGESVAIGESVYGAGGYFYVDDIERLAGKEAAELAARCVDNQYGEIAVVNNHDSAISPD